MAWKSAVCQLSNGVAPAAMARVAWSPVLYMAMKTVGSMAITTVIIMRLRSRPSRT